MNAELGEGLKEVSEEYGADKWGEGAVKGWRGSCGGFVRSGGW